MPWRSVIQNRYVDPRSKLGAYLSALNDRNLKTADERIERFSELCRKSRAEYFRIQTEYRKVFPAPNLPHGKHVKRPR